MSFWHCEHSCPLFPQAKTALDKAKANLEADRQSLIADLKDANAALAESEKRRRGVEAQMSEAQSRIAEDTARLQDLTSQNDRMKVSSVWYSVTSTFLPVIRLLPRMRCPASPVSWRSWMQRALLLRRVPKTFRNSSRSYRWGS